jgi:hypothetical protein
MTDIEIPIEVKLRTTAADINDWNGRTMKTWDEIRNQCLKYKGSDLPRLNFESLVEGFAELMTAAADEIERLRQYEPSPHPSDVNGPTGSD